MDNGKKDAMAGNRKLFLVRFYLVIALMFFMGVGSVAEGKSTSAKTFVPKGKNNIYVSPDKGKNRYNGLKPSRAKPTVIKALDEVRKKDYPNQWTIVLLEGTHLVHQTIPIHDNIYTIVGMDMNKTIIDAGGKARIFHVSGCGGLNLKNLTLKNGHQKEGEKPADGGAIFSNSISELSIDHCSFPENKARRGGAIFCSDTKVRITDSFFCGNWALEDGGAIFLRDTGPTSRIINCSFRKNRAGSGVYDGAGGAVRALEVFDLYHSKNKFRENEAAYGGAVALTGVTNLQQISDCEFEENRAHYDGGAILSNNQGEIRVKGCTYSRNTATRHGGAIFNGDESDLLVINNTFNNNSAWNLGGGIYNGFHLKIEGSAFTGNQADKGGAVCNKGELTAEASAFTGNQAFFLWGTYCGIPVEYDKSGHPGGAIYNTDKGRATVSGCEFGANRAGRGGAMANEEGGSTTVSGCEFSANRAGQGGAMANEGGGSVVVTESAFTDDNTADNGDVLYAQSAETEMHFNRIMGKGIEDIFCEDGLVYADRNWWGSNAGPRERVRGNVFFDPWVVLSVKAGHSDIHNGDASFITADLLHDSDSVYHDPAQGCVPAGPVTLAVPWGSFDSDSIIHSETRQAVDGRVAATFHANEGSTPLPLDLIRVTAKTDGYETTDGESAYVTINRADAPM